jgi:hypothetical protein
VRHFVTVPSLAPLLCKDRVEEAAGERIKLTGEMQGKDVPSYQPEFGDGQALPEPPEPLLILGIAPLVVIHRSKRPGIPLSMESLVPRRPVIGLIERTAIPTAC